MKICEICKKEICKNDETTVCPDCGREFHLKCRRLTGCCVDPECRRKDSERKEAEHRKKLEEAAAERIKTKEKNSEENESKKADNNIKNDDKGTEKSVEIKSNGSDKKRRKESRGFIAASIICILLTVSIIVYSVSQSDREDGKTVSETSTLYIVYNYNENRKSKLYNYEKAQQKEKEQKEKKKQEKTSVSTGNNSRPALKITTTTGPYSKVLQELQESLQDALLSLNNAERYIKAAGTDKGTEKACKDVKESVKAANTLKSKLNDAVKICGKSAIFVNIGPVISNMCSQLSDISKDTAELVTEKTWTGYYQKMINLLYPIRLAFNEINVFMAQKGYGIFY